MGQMISRRSQGGDANASKELEAYLSSLCREERVAVYTRATSAMAGVLTVAEKESAIEALSSLPVARETAVTIAYPDGTRTSVDVVTHESILALKGKIQQTTGHAVWRQQLFAASAGEDPISNEALVGALLPPIPSDEEDGAATTQAASLELFLLLTSDLPLTKTMCVKILSEDGAARLDIGAASVYHECNAGHESWATRFYIRRIDGPSDGPVCAGHLVGLFSESGGKRLDLGPDSMKSVCPPKRESWATQLHIRPCSGGAELRYGELVGVFSSTNNKRLDIGSASMREVAAATDTRSTRLRIQEV